MNKKYDYIKFLKFLSTPTLINVKKKKKETSIV